MPLVCQMCTKADERIFAARLPQFSCQCDFDSFFVSLRYFPHFGKFGADTRNKALVYASNSQFTMQFWRMVN